MKLIHIGAALGVLALLAIPWVSIKNAPEPKTLLALTHQQEVWIAALEWCESNGVVTAINPKDLDNTPSYYSWQFKPATFRYFATAYGIIATSTTDAQLSHLMADYQTERKVIEAMVFHRDDIQWGHQFPWCVRKLGWPPKNDILSK